MDFKFTKSRKTFHNARKGYQEINTEAMRLLSRGGYLASASCSHFMPKDEFRKMLCDAANEAGVSQAAARRTIMDNAGGRTPFQNARGRNSTNTNVRRNSIRSARRNQRTRGRRA